MFLYPAGVFLGVLICITLVSRAGTSLGSRTIPEYLGDRYQSDTVRFLVAVSSLVLFFYLAGQLVASLVIFEILLGLPPLLALLLTSAVILVYVMAGGAHADILTDGIQGFVMLGLALLIVILFLSGFGVEGGLKGILNSLRQQDPALVEALNPKSLLVESWWAVFAIVASVVPWDCFRISATNSGHLRTARRNGDSHRLSVSWGCYFPRLALVG